MPATPLRRYDTLVEPAAEGGPFQRRGQLTSVDHRPVGQTSSRSLAACSDTGGQATALTLRLEIRIQPDVSYYGK